MRRGGETHQTAAGRPRLALVIPLPRAAASTVQQHPRRGPLPRSVLKLADYPGRLREGCFARIWPPGFAPDKGRLVRLLWRYPDGWWQVRGEDGPVSDGEGWAGECGIRAEHLVRCPAPRVRP